MSHEIKVERDEHPFVKEDSFHPALFISMQFSLASDSTTFPLAIKKIFNFRRADFSGVTIKLRACVLQHCGAPNEQRNKNI